MYGRRRIRDMVEESHGQDVKNFIADHFYVDDSLISYVDLDFEKDQLAHCSLGLVWDLRTYTFNLGIYHENKPDTLRGILSTLNNLYDPLGFIPLVTVHDKIILRKVVSSTLGWDSPLSENWIELKNGVHGGSDYRRFFAFIVLSFLTLLTLSIDNF